MYVLSTKSLIMLTVTSNEAKTKWLPGCFVGVNFYLMISTNEIPIFRISTEYYKPPMCRDTFCWGGGAFSPIDQPFLVKKWVTENTVANSLAAWLTSDQHFAHLKMVGGRDVPTPTIGKSLLYVSCFQPF